MEFIKTVTKNTGLKRILYAGYYSYKGLKHSVIYESAFRQEVIAAIVLIPLAVWLDVTQLERLFLISCVFLVMIVELLNTAIEAVVDRVSLEHHELSALAKDLGSAAVLLSLVMSLIVWSCILYP